MIRSVLRSLVRDYVAESSTTPLTDAIINDLLNEGQEELAKLAEYKFASFNITGGLFTGQDDYSLPPNLLSAWQLYYENTSGDLVPIPQQTSHQHMDQYIPGWQSAVAGDTLSSWWVTADVFWVHPAPSAALNGNTLMFLGTMLPPAMVADGETPAALPDAFHRTLAKYAAWQWLTEDRENPTALRMASYWESRFMRDATKLRQLINGRTKTDGPPLRLDPGRPGEWSALLGTDN